MENNNAKKFPVKRLIILGVILVVLVVGFLIFRDMRTCSPKEYEKIEVGMSYDEVVKIIGSKGEEQVSYEGMSVYSWHGSKGDSVVSIMFIDDKVGMIGQEGLID